MNSQQTSAHSYKFRENLSAPHFVVLERNSLVEYDQAVIACGGGSEGALVANRNGVDELQEWVCCSDPRSTHTRKMRVHGHLGMPRNFSRRRSSVHHERMAESAGNILEWRTHKKEHTNGSTHFSLPSPPTMIRLLSPSHARSLLNGKSEKPSVPSEISR